MELPRTAEASTFFCEMYQNKNIVNSFKAANSNFRHYRSMLGGPVTSSIELCGFTFAVNSHKTM
jgi:hypothetical protein